MSNLPTVVETTPVSDDLATDVVIDRFLARVAALTPTQWGILDAIGQRAEARDPVSRWRQIRRHLGVVPASVLRDVLAAAMTVGDYVVGLGAEIEGAFASVVLGRRDARRRLAERVRVERVALESAQQDLPALAPRVRWEATRLAEIARAQPRGPGDALRCLSLALLALRFRSKTSPRGFAEMYELVEPVIPAASLERA